MATKKIKKKAPPRVSELSAIAQKAVKKAASGRKLTPGEKGSLTRAGLTKKDGDLSAKGKRVAAKLSKKPTKKKATSSRKRPPRARTTAERRVLAKKAKTRAKGKTGRARSRYRLRYNKDGDLIGLYIPMKNMTAAERKKTSPTMLSACSMGAVRQGSTSRKSCGVPDSKWVPGRRSKPLPRLGKPGLAGEGLARTRWGSMPKGWPKRRKNPSRMKSYSVDSLQLQTYKESDGDWGFQVLSPMGIDVLASGSGEPSEKMAVREGKAEARYLVKMLADEGKKFAVRAQNPSKLEGPFRYPSGRTVYYDPGEGKYYDKSTDIYLSQKEADALHVAAPKRKKTNPKRKKAAKKKSGRSNVSALLSRALK